MKEIWKPVVGYKNYAVSSWGRIFSFNTKKIMCPWVSNIGGMPSDQYLCVELSKKGENTRFFVHVLILEAFRGPRPPEKESRHLDGNRFNNMLPNLVWGTRKENLSDRRRDMREMKFTPETVEYARKSSKTVRALAKELGCSKSQVANVRRGQAWADIAGPIYYPEYWAARRDHAGWLRQQGYTYREIARFLGRKSKRKISELVNNRFIKRERKSRFLLA